MKHCIAGLDHKNGDEVLGLVNRGVPAFSLICTLLLYQAPSSSTGLTSEEPMTEACVQAFAQQDRYEDSQALEASQVFE